MYQYIRTRSLAWLGVIGLSLTIVGALEPLIQIANIIRYAVAHWHEITSIIWNFLFGLFGLHVDAGLVSLLNAGTFCFSLEVAAMAAPQHVPSFRSFALGVLNRAITVSLFFVILVASLARNVENIKLLPDIFNLSLWIDQKNWLQFGVWLFAMSFSTGVGGNPYVLARRLLDVAALCIVILAFNFIALNGPSIRDWLAAF